MTTNRSAALACLLAASVGCGASQRSARSCTGPSSCSSGETCTRAVCSPPGTASLARDLSRLVLEPNAAVYVSATLGARSVRDASSLSLGARSRILVSFAAPVVSAGLAAPGAIQAAYLVFDRSTSASTDLSSITVRAASIDEAWSPSEPSDRGAPLGGAGTSWASPPHAVAIESSTLTIPASGVGPVRLDVTSYAKRLVDPRSTPVHGLRVEASGEGEGLAIATGAVAGERGPRLEIYFTR